MAEHTDEKTIDGYPVVQGMYVWDYDMRPGTVDLSQTGSYSWDENMNPSHPAFGTRSLWFHVVHADGTRSHMNAERIRVNHPDA